MCHKLNNIRYLNEEKCLDHVSRFSGFYANLYIIYFFNAQRPTNLLFIVYLKDNFFGHFYRTIKIQKMSPISVII